MSPGLRPRQISHFTWACYGICGLTVATAASILHRDDAAVLLQAELLVGSNGITEERGPMEADLHWDADSGLRGVEVPFALEEVEATFNRTFHYVSSATFSVGFLGHTVRCHDVALYLERLSPVWLQDEHDHKKDMVAMLGHVKFSFVFENLVVRLLTPGKLVDMLEPVLKTEMNLKNYSSVLHDFKHRVTSGQRLHRGSRLVLEPNKTGMGVMLDGKDLGFIHSWFLGLAFMHAFLGDKSVMPSFSTTVWDQLATGFPLLVDEPEEVMSQLPWWMILILVLIIVALVSIAFAFMRVLCCLCRSKES